MPQRPARVAPLPGHLPAPLLSMLGQLGIKQLFCHQVAALATIAQGHHTVISTPTASGKTLIYNLAFFQALASAPQASALYLFPLKALAQDQLKTFQQWACLAAPLTAEAAIYDGDTSDYRRKKIRQNPPNLLITNPEMLHLALLPFHDRWGSFFSRLRLVVVDEVHTYRGMFGAHMAQVLRRFQRVCAFYGASPTFVFTSATVANPGPLAGRLIGLPVDTIQESGAPQAARHIVLIDPANGAPQAAIGLIKAALARRLRTIVYTQSRKAAELIAIWAQQRAGPWADRISVYRAGLMPENRRDIERRLKSGELLAVVSTSALELGIDIGDLDICILVGYPGSMISTWQRSGRVGRRGQEAALILIAGEDALDKYFVAQPHAFWQAEAETAIVNPANPVALNSHLVCAAAELPLKDHESWLASDDARAALNRLEQTGQLHRSADGRRWHTPRRRPHWTVHLRCGGTSYRIVEDDTNATMGEIDAHRLFRETHPGAIYLHQGATYRVDAIDERQHAVHVRAAQVDYYTRVRGETDVSIIQTTARKTCGQTVFSVGALKVTDHISAFDQVRSADGRTLARIPLDLPPTAFETQGIWWEISQEICRELFEDGFDLMGALHATEHTAIGLLPLLVLADRNDIGGLSTNLHPQTAQATIFIYDGVPGGAGFAEQLFARADQLFPPTLAAIERCSCAKGCPACVHSPKCGSGNQPMDKQGAARLLALLLSQPPSSKNAITPLVSPIQVKETTRRMALFQRTARYGVFDLETQRSAQEVGGWHRAQLMRVSCGVVYDAKEDLFMDYREEQVPALIEHLKRLDLVVGFNSKRFDYRVLSGYSDFDFGQLASCDLLEHISQRLGFRLSLDHLAEATLGIQKSGSGLDALRWWQQGRMDRLIDYCRMDVQITRDLFLFACDHGYLLYRKKGSGEQLRITLTMPLASAGRF
jgi:DEAD/DEAH box helicase domain-containing protein